jgi:7-carboxy-7-deazaguanine synthase
MRAPGPAAPRHLLVNEIFGPTVQGEGLNLGLPAVFVRLAGCPLSCAWCDTPYSWDWTRYDRAAESKAMTPQEVWKQILGMVAHTGVSTLVVTGGEPAAQSVGLQPLVESAKAAGWWVEMETSGSLRPGPLLGLLDLLTVSPKLSSSQVRRELRRLSPEVLADLAQAPNIVWKFVIDSEADLDEVDELVALHSLSPVFLMAQGATRVASLERTRWLLPHAIARGYRVAPRLHTLLWDDERGR